MKPLPCHTPACGQPRADDCKFCPDCLAVVMEWIDDQYEGIDLEHHEHRPHTYDGETSLYQYIRTRLDHQT